MDWNNAGRVTGLAGISELGRETIATGRRPRTGAAALLVRSVAGLATGLFIIAVPAALIIGAVRFAFSWQPVYTYAITTYHADAFTGISTPELLRATHTIRNYFTNDQRDLDIVVTNAAGQEEPLFNAREIAHMRDVKALVGRFYFVLALAIVYIVAFAVLMALGRVDGARRLARALLTGALVTAGVMLAFGAASMIGFDQLFVWFHRLSFSNSFWELDPARDHLIQMFQPGFWFDATIFVALLALTGALLVGALSGGCLLVSRRRA